MCTVQTAVTSDVSLCRRCDEFTDLRHHYLQQAGLVGGGEKVSIIFQGMGFWLFRVVLVGSDCLAENEGRQTASVRS